MGPVGVGTVDDGAPVGVPGAAGPAEGVGRSDSGTTTRRRTSATAATEPRPASAARKPAVRGLMTRGAAIASRRASAATARRSMTLGSPRASSIERSSSSSIGVMRPRARWSAPGCVEPCVAATSRCRSGCRGLRRSPRPTARPGDAGRGSTLAHVQTSNALSSAVLRTIASPDPRCAAVRRGRLASMVISRRPARRRSPPIRRQACTRMRVDHASKRSGSRRDATTPDRRQRYLRGIAGVRFVPEDGHRGPGHRSSLTRMSIMNASTSPACASRMTPGFNRPPLDVSPFLVQERPRVHPDFRDVLDHPPDDTLAAWRRRPPCDGSADPHSTFDARSPRRRQPATTRVDPMPCPMTTWRQVPGSSWTR